MYIIIYLRALKRTYKIINFCVWFTDVLEVKKAVKTNEDDAFKADVVTDQVQNNEEASGFEKEANRLNKSALDFGSLLRFEETDEDQISQPTTMESILFDQTSIMDSGSLLHFASEETNQVQISQPTTIESLICDRTSTMDSEKPTLGKTTIYVRVTFQWGGE